MKKSWFIVIALILAAVLFIVPGCSPGSDAEGGAEDENGSEAGENGETEEPAEEGEEEAGPGEPAWEIVITGPGGEETIVTLEELKAMPAMELEAESKSGVSKYKGVLLSLVLENAGITEATEVTVTAADGYSAAISGDIAFAANTILAYERDGADLSGDEKNGPVRLVAPEAESSQVWVGKLSSIAVQ